MKERINEIVSVALIIVFIIAAVSKMPDSQKTVDEVCSAVLTVLDTSKLEKGSNIKIKEEFMFEPGDFDGVAYYLTDDTVMNVQEFLLIKLKNDAQAEPLIESLQKRIDEKIEIFEGYSPENKALLEKSVLKSERGFILYAVCDNPEQIVQTFKDSL